MDIRVFEVLVDAMKSNIEKGELIIVDTRETDQVNGKILIFQSTKGLLIIRIVFQKKDGWILVPDYRKYHCQPLPTAGML